MPLTVRFVPYRLLASEIAERLASSRAGVDALAPFAEEVIVASGGVSNAISAALLACLPQGVAGLRMQTLDGFAQRVVNAAGRFPRVVSEPERRLAMRVAARSIRDPLFESRGVASMLERSYRDVRDSGITLEEFTNRVNRARGLRNISRTRLIIRAWQQYESLVSQLKAIDPADLLAMAVRQIGDEHAVIAPQLLAGFYDMTGAQLALVDALRARNLLAAAWIPLGDDAAGDYAFAHPFSSRTSEGAAAIRNEPRVIATAASAVTRYDTRGHEIASICSEVGHLLSEGTSASHIGISARSLEPYDLELLALSAHAHGFAISPRREIPLVAQRIGRGAVTLLRLRDRNFPRGDIFELLRDGLRSETTISIDRADQDTRRAGIAGGTSDELRNVRSKSFAVADYVKLVAELESITSAIDEAFLSAITTHFRIESEADARAADALDEIAALFRRTSAWRNGFDVAAAIDAIEQRTTPRLELQASEPPPIVWTGDLMQLRGRSFDRLFFLRAQDGILPQRRNEDPLLPDADRQRLNLRQIGNGDAEERLLYRLMLDSAASRVAISYAGSDGFGKSLRPSRYVRDLPTDSVDPVDPAGAGPRALRPLQLLVRAGRSGAFDGYIDDERLRARIRESIQSLSPTQLEDFGECPQKFFLKHILGVRDVDDPDHDLQMTPRDKGTLDHAILERFYRELTRVEFGDAVAHLPRLIGVLQERLHRIIGEEFDRFETQQPAFNRTIRNIERASTRRILRDFVARDLDDLAENGLFPEHFEYRFGSRHREAAEVEHAEPFVIESNGVPVRIEGTIDRIDRGTDRLRVVDYKSGKALRHKNLEQKIRRGTRLQLPLYALAVSEFFGAPVEQVIGAIKPLVYSRGGKHEFALSDTYDELSHTLTLFVQAILTGQFPAFPDEGDEIGSCKYCPVNYACRTKHDADERRAVRRHPDARTLLTDRGEVRR